jgi:hypothetical protein
MCCAWYFTLKWDSIQAPIIGPVHTPVWNPAACGPSSTTPVSSQSCSTVSRQGAPGALPVRSPSVPALSYQRSQSLMAERDTCNSPVIEMTDLPAMYPSTAVARRQVARSEVLVALSCNAWSCCSSEAVLRSDRIASPFLERAMLHEDHACPGWAKFLATGHREPV